MKTSFKFLQIVALAVAGLSASAIAAHAQDFPTHLIVFGDSLSDTGNDLIATSGGEFGPLIPPPQMYFQGRFSNGPVAFEYLWALLKPGAPPFAFPSLAIPGIPSGGAISFAFGGSGSGLETVTPGGFPVPGLKGQIGMFQAALQENRAPEDALYAVWTGPNDYPADPGRPFLTPAEVVTNITDAVETLYELGARYVLVVNLPDLGVQPLVPPGSPLSTLLTELSAEHNRRLVLALKRLEAHLLGLTIIQGDVTEVVESLSPTFETTIPLVDVLLPSPGPIPDPFCLFIDPSSCPAVENFAMSAQFLFWDAGHPTTAAHQRIAEHLFQAVWKGLRRQVKAAQR